MFKILINTGILFLPFMDMYITLLDVRIGVFTIYITILTTVYIAGLINNSITYRKGYASIYLTLLIFTYITSTLVSYEVNLAIIGSINNLMYIAWGLFVFNSISSMKIISSQLRYFQYCTIWVSMLGWLQIVFGVESFALRSFVQGNAKHYDFTSGVYYDRIITAFNDPLMSGMFLSTAMSIVYSKYYNIITKKDWILTVVFFLFIIGPALGSGSRSSIIAIFIVGTVIAISQKHSRSTILLFLISSAAIIYISPSWSSFGFLPMLESRMLDPLSSSRYLYWLYLLNESMGYPFGVGLGGNFQLLVDNTTPGSLAYITTKYGLTANSHGESLYMTWLIEVGWLGVLAIIGILFSTTMNLIKRIKVNNQENINVSAYIWVLTGIMSIAISGVSAYGYNNKGIAMLFWYFIAAGSALVNIPKINNIRRLR